MDTYGNIVGEYMYDAWGNHTVETSVDGIAELNPFRYRGYYFDTETGLYYLKSRYYDPQTGRFINMDDLALLDVLKSQVNGLNLYAYCSNNPVMNTDSDGMFLRRMGSWVNRNVIQPTVGFVSGKVVQSGVRASIAPCSSRYWFFMHYRDQRDCRLKLSIHQQFCLSFPC